MGNGLDLAMARRWWGRAWPQLRSTSRQGRVFLRLLGRQLRQDAVALHSAALAFITILSLVPLLAAFAFIGQRVFVEYQEQILGSLAQVIPYPEAQILEQVNEFLAQAHNLRGFAVVIFIAATLAVFGSIEETINRIWNVSERRPFRVRLLSVTLLLFWGPLLIGVSFSGVLFLGEWARLEPPAVVAYGIPFLGSLLLLTMLYWLVPYTNVGFRHALAGGIVAGLLLEGLRQGFSTYIHYLPNIKLIYGGFAFLLLFVISIQLCWWIVLVGCEVAYVSQHFKYLARTRARVRGRPAGQSWIALVALAVVARRFLAGEPLTPQAWLASRLGLPVGQLEDALQPLLEAGILRTAGGETRQYLLAQDPYELPLEDVFALYEPASADTLTSLDEEDLETNLEALREELADGRSKRLARKTLADLVKGAEAGRA